MTGTKSKKIFSYTVGNGFKNGLNTMKTGIEILLNNSELMNRLSKHRVGVLAHAASITNKGEHIITALRKNNVFPARIFAPEHGLWGAAQDMEGVDHCYDAIINQDVFSLYGHSEASLFPTTDAIDNLDDIIIDVQDVGARYYTFVYTALFLTQAALEHNLDVYIIDRPNPIDGVTLEGNLIDDDFRSFVGMRSGMTRHGMTCGELISMWCETENTPGRDHLHICWMEGYDRHMDFNETGCLWAMPSPNMPTPDTATVYPGMCLIEGTNLSEGRGTTRPFEIFGAPWLKVNETHKALNLLNLPGAMFRPLDFKPMFQKHAGKVCHGFQLHVTDRHLFRPVLTGIAILSVIHAIHPEFAWRTEVYEFVGNRLAIDLLLGNDKVRRRIESQENPYAIMESFIPETESWQTQRREFLRY